MLEEAMDNIARVFAEGIQTTKRVVWEEEGGVVTDNGKNARCHVFEGLWLWHLHAVNQSASE